VIRCDLIVKISNEAQLQLLGDKLRSAPIKMPVDAAGIACTGIGEIPSQSGNGGKFMAGLRIETGVADAAVQCAVARPMLARLELL
jgi:hypothetical protein